MMHRTRSGPAANSWLAYADTNPTAAMRLYCFPYAGGGASIYTRWLSALGAAVSVCPIQLPGRGSRMKEPPLRSVEAVVGGVLEALEPLLQAPFALFGHSMGALICFELARELRRRGWPSPARLFVSGHRAPHLPDPDPPMHALPEAEFIEELRKLNGTPAEVLENPELMQMLLPLLRADTSVCETYAYREEAPLGCPISAFGGLTDVKVSREEVEDWQRHSTVECRIRMFPGDHFFVHTEAGLLEALRSDLAEMTRRASPAGGLGPAQRGASPETNAGI